MFNKSTADSWNWKAHKNKEELIRLLRKENSHTLFWFFFLILFPHSLCINDCLLILAFFLNNSLEGMIDLCF